MFNNFCLLYDEEIHEGKCVDILAELDGLKKVEVLKFVVLEMREKYSNPNIDLNYIRKICKKCPNYPA